MALGKLVAVLNVAVVVCAIAIVAAAPAATAYYPGYGEAPESCERQIEYFTNCLGHDEIQDKCCSVVDNFSCLCQLKREVAVPCVAHGHGRRRNCPVNGKVAKAVRVAELKLWCMQKLKC
ncbi:hypothetical protein ACP70R_019529 [Stipagrostis hirtigluma subsp. patula]